MPSAIKPCSICLSPIRADLEKRILAGETARAIADETQCSRRQLLNHFARGHVERAKKVLGISTVTAQRKKAAEGPAAESQPAETPLASALAALLDQANQVMTNMTQVYDDAIANGQHSMALTAAQKQINALERIRSLVEMAAKASGEYDQKAMNLYVLPEWKEVMVFLVNTLAPFPEARQAVVDGLRARVRRTDVAVPELEDLRTIEAEVVAG